MRGDPAASNNLQPFIDRERHAFAGRAADERAADAVVEAESNLAEAEAKW